MIGRPPSVSTTPLTRLLRKTWIEPTQGIHEDGCDREVPNPVAIRGNDMPRCCVRRGGRQRLFVGGGVSVEPAARLLVFRVVLPVLRRIGEPFREPLSLLFCRHVEKAFQHGRPLVGEKFLELDDPSRPLSPHLHGGEPQDSHGDHVLVVRAVEDSDHAACRGVRMDAPEEVVRELDRSRGLERRDQQPCGSTPLNTARMVPSLPEASRPWSTRSTLRRCSA